MRNCGSYTGSSNSQEDSKSNQNGERNEEKEDKRPSVILVGTKCDSSSQLSSVVDFGRAEELAKRYNVDHIQCSSKTNKNVDEIFQILTATILEKKWKLERHEQLTNGEKETSGTKKSAILLKNNSIFCLNPLNNISCCGMSSSQAQTSV
jgi:GTPase SAR1 family protein